MVKAAKTDNSSTMSSYTAGVGFVHLRVHSAFSLLEGAIHIGTLAKLARDNDMPALGLSDSGNLFGALEFSQTLAENGVQPIMGCTLRIAFDEIGEQNDNRYHDTARVAMLPLIAKNECGFMNLMHLSSCAYLESDAAQDPQIPLSLLRRHSEGLIALSGGPTGAINQALVERAPNEAERIVECLLDVFGDRFYIELQRHSLPEEMLAEKPLVDFAYQKNIPLVAVNEPHFARSEEFEAHDALVCIRNGTFVAEENRPRLTPEHYFKSPAEMVALFADLPEAVANTIEIARRCAYRPHTRAPILPSFLENDGLSDEENFEAEVKELRSQSEEGLKVRLSQVGDSSGKPEQDYWDRLNYELDVIIGMKFPGYFLIVADFIKWAKSRGIPVGPGRGSGAGSVVAWSLTITDLDPLRFDLLFERFLNPERVSMPDFDVDFCQDRREEVIEYVQERYGVDQVAQIITFGKLQARAVLRDVGRVLQLPYGQVDRLCKMIPNNPANPTTLEEAINTEAPLREARDEDKNVAKMLDIGLKLEGLYRHASTHAAGVVIGDRKLDRLVPLYRDPRSEMPVSQYNMKWVEQAGLVKFDFLGLKTLTILEKTLELLADRDIHIDLLQIPLDDAPTFKMLSTGETVGVFQLESSGMRDIQRKMKPDRFEDIIALNALYRPGPMASIPTYIACKLGLEKPDYMHPSLEPLLKESYGVIVYQEHVMQIAQILAGYSLGEADLLRRAMGKKIQSEMDKQKTRFVEGAVERGVNREKAEFIFELINKFAGYGFPKGHAAAYALIAYQTAFLKANYPVEFLAASMTLDIGNTDKLLIFKRDVERLDIKIQPPCINLSSVNFTVRDGGIFYSLAALKNVGRQAVEHIVALRNEDGPFVSIGDFASRINPRIVNKRALESLAKAGAFDVLNDNRAQVLGGVETILGLATRSSGDRAAGQNDLFGGEASEETVALPGVERWLAMDHLGHEFDAVGFYLSGHPLDDYRTALRQSGVLTWKEFAAKAMAGLTAGKIAGTVAYCQERRSKSGNRFAFVGFSDSTGQFEAVVFSDVLGNCRELLEPGSAVVLVVEADCEGEDVKLRLQNVTPVDTAIAKVQTGLNIYIHDETALESLSKRLNTKGKTSVSLMISVDQGRHEVEISLPGGYQISPQIRGAIKTIPGVIDVRED